MAGAAAQNSRQKRTISLAILALAWMLLFLWLGDQVHDARTQQFDVQVRSVVHGWSSPPLTWLMLSITQLGSTLVVTTFALVAVVVFLALRWKLAAILLFADLSVAILLNSFLKYLFHRPRPEPFFGIPPPHTYSFPSGHSLFAICFYGMLAALLGERVRSGKARVTIWMSAVLVVMMVGFSRLYLGVHYPTDVVAGWAIGLAWVNALLILLSKSS
jgi:undecaprenyl-diphosphatase